MTRIGLHKIIGQMLYRGPLTLSDITKYSNLAKPTVHYHLKNLLKQKIVAYDAKTGKYEITIDEDLKKQILNCLKNERTIEQLREELIKVSKNKNREESPLTLLIKDKEFGNKLNDLLEFLYREELVTEISDYVLSGTKFKEEYRWTLTWKGSTRIGICHICKKEIDSKLSSAAIQTIQSGHEVEEVDIFDTMLIHPKCTLLSSEQYLYSKTGIYSHSNDLCDYCGLPFSEKRLQQFASNNNKTSFELLYNLLSLEEIDALNKERRLELISEVKNRLDTEPPIGVFDGEVLLKDIFYSMNAPGNPALFPSVYFKPQSKSFDFLNIPRLSDLERLAKIVEKHSKRKFDTNRLKELFEEWRKYHTKQEKEIDGMVSSLLSTPMSKIYPKIWNYEPGPWRESEEKVQSTDPEKYTSSFGFSFVIKDEAGNQYHEMCYQHLQNLKPTIQPKSEKTKRGS